MLVAFSSMAQNVNFTSNLPLVYINTNGKIIPDNPKIIAEMGIIWNGQGKTNSTTDLFNGYNGKIGIEIRGSSSQMFPKKAYGFETRNEMEMDTSVSLLGMPEEEDWILYAPYSDKTLIRNALTYSLASQFGYYTPRFRFVELFLNEKYQGIYVLMEKIKRDKNRVDIAKLTENDVEGEDLTGGYIIKVDKTTGSGGEGWYSKYTNLNSSNTFYQYEYPSSDKILNVQKQYIQEYIFEFETTVRNKDFSSVTGYPAFIEVNSVYDFIIMSELAKNVDSYRLSTYFYKDKNGKLVAGPIWDYNLGYGNANYAYAWETSGLQIYANLQGDNWQNPFWWSGLLLDKKFVNDFKCRWQEYRENELSNKRIFELADSLLAEIGEASERNFQRWPVIGEWVWPNYYVGNTYMEEVTWLKSWITSRLYYLDQALPGVCGAEIPPEFDGFEMSVIPNPFTTKLFLEVGSDLSLTLQFQLFSINGTEVKNQSVRVIEGLNRIEVDTRMLQSGVYIYRIYKGHNVVSTGKVVKL